MMFDCRIQTPCLVMMVLMISFPNIIFAANDAICQSINGSSGGQKLNIQTIGLVKGQMILITNTQFVYDEPSTSLNQQIQRLFFEKNPIQLQQKYPKLYADPTYQKTEKILFNSFTVSDSQSRSICFTTKDSQSPDGGVCYDIDKQNVFPGYSYSGNDYQVLISSTKDLTYFALQHAPDGSSLKIAEYKFTGTTLQSSEHIDQTSSFLSMCSPGPSKIHIVEGDCPKSGTITWPILKGFRTESDVYLFGSDYVFVFPVKAFYDHKPEKVTKIDLANFFTCSGVVHPQKASAFPIWIILVILLVLLILLCCCLWIGKQVYDHEHEKNKKVKLYGDKTKRSSGGGNVSKLTSLFNSGSRTSSKRSQRGSRMSSKSGSRKSGSTSSKRLTGNSSNTSKQRSSSKSSSSSKKSSSKSKSSRSTSNKSSSKKTTTASSGF